MPEKSCRAFAVVLALVLGGSLAQPLHAAPPTYRLKRLEPPEGWIFLRFSTITNSGEIVGNLFNIDRDIAHAFSYKDGVLTDLVPGASDAPVMLQTVNAKGHMVIVRPDDQYFLYANGGLTPLDFPGFTLFPRDMNIYGLWRLVGALVRVLQGGAELPLPEGWWKTAAEWLLSSALFQVLAHLAGFALFGTLAYVAAAFSFSLIYEAIAGPFLDEIHGRIEERWFGVNPRDALQRPTSLAPRRCAEISALAGAVALLALVPWWLLAGPLAWAALVLGALAPFALAAVLQPEYGRWLAWVVRVEGGTLWVSLKAMALAGLVLLCSLPLQFLVPVVGQLLFVAAAGFTTALSLLDIPFSRRQWSLRQRLAFLTGQLPAVVAFGVVASLVFVVPLIGPLLMVPAASVGGLWLLCRLDKGPPADLVQDGP